MSDLLELAERCEAASGPSEILNRAISTALDVPPLYKRRGRHSATWPDFTASIDAAMTLVPEGHGVLTTNISWEKWAQIVHEGKLADGNGIISGKQSAKAATLPLALCAAALKARSHP